MRKIIIAAMTMGLATGCYAGIDDAGDDSSTERGTKSCYYSYYSGSSTSYTSNSDGKTSATLDDGANAFTVQVDAVEGQDAYAALAAAATGDAAWYHSLACQNLDDFAKSCAETCREYDAFSNPKQVPCDTCEPETDRYGNVIQSCPPSDQVARQLEEKPYEGRTTRYFDDPNGRGEEGLMIQIFDARKRGELLEAQVAVSGPCNCACEPE